MAQSPRRRPIHYVLIDRIPVPLSSDDILLWAAAFENMGNRHVANTELLEGGTSPIRISTVFIGVDYNFDETGPPLLFETMVFGGALDQYQWRCSTWEEAETQHAAAVVVVQTVLANQAKAAEAIEIMERMWKLPSD